MKAVEEVPVAMRSYRTVYEKKKTAKVFLEIVVETALNKVS